MKASPKIHGTKPVGYYLSNAYDATLADVIQGPGREQQYLYLLLVFQRDIRPPSEPCLIISSERAAQDQKAVLGYFDDTGHRLLRKELGDWTNRTAFARRAITLAGDRLSTTFAEHHPQEKASG